MAYLPRSRCTGFLTEDRICDSAAYQQVFLENVPIADVMACFVIDFIRGK